MNDHVLWSTPRISQEYARLTAASSNRDISEYEVGGIDALPEIGAEDLMDCQWSQARSWRLSWEQAKESYLLVFSTIGGYRDEINRPSISISSL